MSDISETEAETIVLAMILKIIDWFMDEEREFGTQHERAKAVFFILQQLDDGDLKKLRALSETDLPL